MRIVTTLAIGLALIAATAGVEVPARSTRDVLERMRRIIRKLRIRTARMQGSLRRALGMVAQSKRICTSRPAS
jgi:hypothetical protein